MENKWQSFLKKEPNPLKFGTSGLRGFNTDLTDLECYINAKGFIEYLKNLSKEDGGIEEGSTVYLAGDLRSSTDRIMKTISKAIEDAGCLVKNCGKLPTPAVSYCGMQNNSASIMVTGSHIPADMNGIKFNKVSGEVLKSDEKNIGEYVSKEREIIYETLGSPDGVFNEEAMFIDEPSIPALDESQRAFYIKRYTDVFPNDCLKNKKIVIYQHSSVGRDIVTEIFEKLGAEIIIEGRTDEFVSIDTEAIKEEDAKLMKEWAQKHKPFALISFDGDCDRPWLSSDTGEFLRGDLLGGLVILYLEADFGAVPVTCSGAVDKILDKTKLIKTKIGSPYVISKMIDAQKEGFKKVVGWEVNGGFMTQSDFEINGGVLKSLPTRDAVLPLLSVLLLAIKKNKSISEIMNELPKIYTDANKIKNFPTENSKKIINKYSPEDSEIEKIEFFDEEISIIYKDNSKKIMKNNSELGNKWIDKKTFLEKNYLTPNNIANIKSFVYTDGLRILLENEELIHLRPSSNAPELRCYANAKTSERAKELVEIVLTKIIKNL